MKKISIETQKKMMYIPYINILNMFIWLYNCISLKPPRNCVPKTLTILFVNSLPLLLLQIILSNIWPAVANILTYINAYLIPLLISRGLINYQEDLLHESQEK